MTKSKNRKKAKRARAAQFATSTMMNSVVERPIPQPVPVPSCTHVQLVFPFNLGPASSAAEASQVFRGNSLYDPDQTGTGAQPVYFDQWMALYSQYRVLGVWLDAKFSNVDGQHVMAAVAPSPSASVFATAVTLDIAGMRNSISAEAHSGGPLGRLCRYFSTARSWGVRKQAVLDDTDFTGGSSGNPLNQFYLGIGLQTSGNTDTSWLAGRLIYDVRFEAPRLQNLSARVLKDPPVGVLEDLVMQSSCKETITMDVSSVAAPCQCAVRRT
jgi:hypothetical protein